MVATRRNIANAASPPKVSSKSIKRRKITAEPTIESLPKNVTIQSVISRSCSPVTHSTAQSEPSSDLDESFLNSPLTETIPAKEIYNELGQMQCDPARPSIRPSTRPSTRHVVATFQEQTLPGGSLNPIVLTEDSPKAQDRGRIKHFNRIGTYQSQDRYINLYNSVVPQTALAPKPANGSILTAQTGSEMYQMCATNMNNPVWHAMRNQHAWLDVPLEPRYPVSARYLSSTMGIAMSPIRSAIQYLVPQLPTYPHHRASPPFEEDQLRRKAREYVHEYSRPSLQNGKLAEIPDQVNDSASKTIDRNRTRAQPRCPTQSSSDTRLEGKSVIVLPNPDFQFARLIEQASLLTSLLRLYSQSSDREGLRDDIAMLVSVQSQHLANWLNFELGQSRRTANPHTSRGSMVTTKPVIHRGLAEGEKRKKQDDEIRGLLSADAKLWQDGSGLGVASVHAEPRASTAPGVDT